MPPTDPGPGTVRGRGGSSQPYQLVQPDGFGKASLSLSAVQFASDKMDRCLSGRA